MYTLAFCFKMWYAICMWKIEVFIKDLTDITYPTIGRLDFDGFASRKEAEEKILTFWDKRTETVGYTFYIIAPWGNVFPVDLFPEIFLDITPVLYDRV